MEQDIIIIGAGPAGLSFARDIASTGMNITILEKQPEKVLENPPYDGREIALTHLSRRIMSNLGMWDLIPNSNISMIKTAKILNGKSPYALCFDHDEAGEDTLGYMISNQQIRKAAYRSLKDFNNIRIMDKTEVTNLSTDNKEGWVKLSDGKDLKAPLIIAADSRFSATRRMMGISTSMLDFGRTCVVCTMSVQLPHNDTAYECFHFGRTLAVLPMNNNQVSIVITLKSEESHDLLSMSNGDFAMDIERRIESKFGKMELTSKLYPYPLVATFAKTFNKNRFAMIGDAAVGMHPVTAHGFNLGLRGAHILAKEIKTAMTCGIDYASHTILDNYSRKHRHICAPLYHGTNALVTLYTRETTTAKFARRALLRLGNHIGPARRLIINQLTESKVA